MTLRAPFGWNLTSNARHEVKLRDYIEKIKGDVGAHIEAKIKVDHCDDYYGLGHEVVESRYVKALIDFVSEQMRRDGECAPTKDSR